MQIKLNSSLEFLILLAQADLKAKAKEMDERKEEEERLRRGEESAIKTIYSDEVNRKSFGIYWCLLLVEVMAMQVRTCRLFPGQQARHPG